MNNSRRLDSAYPIDSYLPVLNSSTIQQQGPGFQLQDLTPQAIGL